MTIDRCFRHRHESTSAGPVAARAAEDLSPVTAVIDPLSKRGISGLSGEQFSILCV
jgi:hypothetical protein